MTKGKAKHKTKQTYKEKMDPQGVEVVDNMRLGMVGESRMSKKNIGWMASLGTCFHHKLTNIATPSHNQNLAFGCH